MEPVAALDVDQYRREWSATSFLASVSPAVADSCFSAGEFVRFAAREELIRQDAEDHSIYLLLSGCVKVTSIVGDDTVALLAVRVGGDVVGELAAMDGMARSATVQVCGRQPALACAIAGPTFLEVLKRYPEALLVLTRTVGVRLRASTRRRVDFLRCSPTVRMARALVELADDHGRPLGPGTIMISVNLKQVELGTLIGVREATAQRALRDLRQAGLVMTSQRHPIVRDIDALRATAQLQD